MSTTPAKIDTTFSIDTETGHDLVTCEVNSGYLKAITVDTYQTFELADDSYMESLFDHLSYTYTGTCDLAYDDFDWTYDNKLWLSYVIDGAIDYIISEQPEPIVKSIEVVEAYSPAFRNFETDSFLANWTVDETALREWWATTEFTFESEMASEGRHGSHSGFISFVDSKYRDDQVQMEVTMMLDRWIESWSEFGEFLCHVEEWNTGNGEQDQCIEFTPDTVTGLMAWAQANYTVTDEMIGQFVPVEVEARDLEVGDHLFCQYKSVRQITAIREREIPEQNGGGMGLEIDVPWSDDSPGMAGFRKTDKVFRAFNPNKDGENA